MVPRQWAKRFSVILVLVAWLCLGLAAPIILGLYSPDMASDAVEAAPSDAYTIVAPVLLSATPRIWIERGTLSYVDNLGKPIPLADAGPGQNIRLSNATIVVAADAPAERNATEPLAPLPLAPLMEALLEGRYESLSLRRTTVMLRLFDDSIESILDVKADVSLRRRGQVSIKGSGVVRGQTVALDTTANVAQIERKSGIPPRLPIKLSLKGPRIDLSFDGRLQMSPSELALQGFGELAIPSIREVARWFGANWPSGAGLREASVRGQMTLQRNSLTFENAVVRMDGNEATGVVALRVGSPRPIITGTLAYKQFDAKPYVSGRASDPFDGMTWSSLAGGVLTVPLGLHLDADLRVSADKVVLGGIETGRAAATVSLKDGRLLADLADIKFNGGEGGGQITADYTGFVPKFTFRGKLVHVEMGPLAAGLIGQPALQGAANIVGDLAGSGGTMQEVLNGLVGKIVVRSLGDVKVGLDLRSLVAAARLKDVVGWSAAQRGITNFEQLDLRLVLRDGSILTESMEARSADGSWSATGVVNLLSERIDIKLSQSGATAAAVPAGVAPIAVLELDGSLRAPTIRASTSADGTSSRR